MVESFSQDASRGDRRSFLYKAGLGALATVAVPSVAGCSALQSSDASEVGTEPDAEAAAPATEASNDDPSRDGAAEASGDGADGSTTMPLIEWEMPTSWPASLTALWSGAQFFTERVAALTDGRFRITARPAGEVAGPFDILPLVSDGTFPIGATASYYYLDRSPVLAFGTALPFGLTHRQGLSWLYAGGGLELLHEIYARDFNLINFPAGATGAQMGGWFRTEITSLSDLQGLRMRIPGLGGEVMSRLGVEVQNLGAADISDALVNDEIDAAEFVGPFDDTGLGLSEAAPFYYYPGFWEPGALNEIEINLDRWNALPLVYQEAIQAAATEAITAMMADYDAVNGQALNDLVAGGTELRLFPQDLLDAGRAASGIVLDEFAATDPDFARILAHWRNFRRQVGPWFSLAEAALIQ